jgi:hypothetical protein
MNDIEFEDKLNTVLRGTLACCRLFSIRYVLLRRAKRNIKRSQVQFVNSVFKGHLNKIINLEKDSSSKFKNVSSPAKNVNHFTWQYQIINF